MGSNSSLSTVHLQGKWTCNVVLEKVMVDKSRMLKVKSDKNIQTHFYHDCLEVTLCSNLSQ